MQPPRKRQRPEFIACRRTGAKDRSCNWLAGQGPRGARRPAVGRSSAKYHATLVAVPLAVSVAAKIECEHMVRIDQLRREVTDTVGISCQPMQEKEGRFTLATEVSVVE